MTLHWGREFMPRIFLLIIIVALLYVIIKRFVGIFKC